VRTSPGSSEVTHYARDDAHREELLQSAVNTRARSRSAASRARRDAGALSQGDDDGPSQRTLLRVKLPAARRPAALETADRASPTEQLVETLMGRRPECAFDYIQKTPASPRPRFGDVEKAAHFPLDAHSSGARAGYLRSSAPSPGGRGAGERSVTATPPRERMAGSASLHPPYEARRSATLEDEEPRRRLPADSENVKEAAAGSCANSRFRLLGAVDHFGFRLHCPPFASEAEKCFRSNRRPICRTECGAWLPNGLLLMATARSSVQRPEGYGLFSRRMEAPTFSCIFRVERAGWDGLQEARSSTTSSSRASAAAFASICNRLKAVALKRGARRPFP